MVSRREGGTEEGPEPTGWENMSVGWGVFSLIWSRARLKYLSYVEVEEPRFVREVSIALEVSESVFDESSKSLSVISISSSRLAITN